MRFMNLIVFVFVIAFAVQSNAQSGPAKDLFAGKCAVCHAADGSASTGIGKSMKIPSFHSPDVQKQPDADLKTMISKGKGAMPTFAGKLSDTQIDQLVNYVRTLGKN